MRSRVVPLVAALVLLAVGLWLGRPADSSVDQDAQPGRVVHGVAGDTSTPFNLVSLPALIADRSDGHGLRLERVTARGPGWVRHGVSYRSGGRRLTGTLTRPTGRRPHPLVVALHGWIPPDQYRRGAGLVREEARLAEAGFAVLHPDYRNFGGSDRDADTATAGRAAGAGEDLLGYPGDVVGALAALRRADVPGVDLARVGLLGRSMGGGVALQVAAARPDLVDALLLYSPVSSDAADVYHRWVDERPELAERVDAAYGSPESDPVAWATYSSRSYLDRVDVPVEVHHGTADPVCPLRWSEATVDALHRAGVTATLVRHHDEGHRFDRSWPRFMADATDYFRARLG